MSAEPSQLVEMTGLQGKPFPTTFERHGLKLKLELRPGIVTTQFLETLDQMHKAERARATKAAIQTAAQNGSRATRRKLASARGKRTVERAAQAEGVDLAAVTPEQENVSALQARANQMRFMGETCYRVIASWNLGRGGEPVALSVDEFVKNWDFELLEEFFEFVCFGAAAPKK